MPADYLPRTSIEGSHYAAIDSELKSLKFLSRRIQSATIAHLTELQILRRLFYKNKNQHRGALFWRNISEVRRYAGRLQKLDVLNGINAFRNTFYGENQGSASKGPWSHVPSDGAMRDFRGHCDIVLTLSEKISVICLDAYRMFHRSMQSGAFLQVLLMFIAIASRMRLVSMEFVEIFSSVKSCLTRLSGVALVTESICHVKANSMTGVIGVFAQAKEVKDMNQSDLSTVAVADDLDASDTVVGPIGILDFGGGKSSTLPEPPIAATTKVAEASIITRALSESKPKKLQTELESQGGSTKPAAPKKKKRKPAKNEIDEIFGF